MNKKYSENLVKTTINITEKQQKWIEEKSINLSDYVRKYIQSVMEVLEN